MLRQPELSVSRPSALRLLSLALIVMISVSIAKFHVMDYDNLLGSGKFLNPHYWLAVLLGWAPLLLLLVNCAAYCYVLYGLANRYGVPLLLVLVSPFAVFNTLDAFNKFSFLMFVGYCFAIFWVNPKMRGWALLLLASLVVMHPLNVLLLSAILPITVVGGLAGLLLLTGAALPDDFVDVILGDKADLLSQYGSALASSYGGNYKLVDAADLVSLGPLDIDVFGPARIFWFPSFMDSPPQALDFLLAAYMAIGFVGICYVVFRSLRPSLMLFLLLVLFLIPTFVGNIAVIYRHVIPMLPALLLLAAHRGDARLIGAVQPSEQIEGSIK
ncbi:MAG: hypothetical protein ACOYNB_05890 [Aquabacterium sp.]|uniref:hypothetical protein n=1 Tax=Aquabacterium sp. TaxID=1872578 RepID=UPI003BC58F05